MIAKRGSTDRKEGRHHGALGCPTPHSALPHADRNENPGLGQAFLHHLKDQGCVVGVGQGSSFSISLLCSPHRKACRVQPVGGGSPTALLLTWEGLPSPLIHSTAFLSPQLSVRAVANSISSKKRKSGKHEVAEFRKEKYFPASSTLLGPFSKSVHFSLFFRSPSFQLDHEWLGQLWVSFPTVYDSLRT